MKKDKITFIPVPTGFLDTVIDKRLKTPEQHYEEKLLRKTLESAIDAALSALPKIEQKVLEYKFGLKNAEILPYEEIAKTLNISKNKVQHIEKKALRRLRNPQHINEMDKEELEPFHEKTNEDQDTVKLVEFPTSLDVILISSNVGMELIQFFAEHPHEMKTMNRRVFEEMIAELFDGFGYEVELTGQTRDGGRDIIAIKESEVAVKYLIEAKRPEPGNPVGVVPVRALYGVKKLERATKAILATTTYFSRDAKVEFKDVTWELELREYEGIIEWINKYLELKND